ncbi:DUF397 domain-containing protein [Streptomyces antibioticus]|uniref:DUF397 domain-containing protein n=1 Tax=Streptomyces antibioticus TaxID=1890 RepID=UPI0033CF09AB
MRNIPDRTVARRKSTYSGGGDDRLEVADGQAPFTPVRDSGTSLGPQLLLRAEAWSAFVEDLEKG